MPSEPNAVVSGRVLDAAGIPVPDARVEALEEGAWFLEFPGMFPWLAAVRTGADGRFRMEIPAGPVLLAACLQRTDSTWPGPRGDAHGRRVVLRPGENLDAVELRLSHALADLGVVEGRVLDEDGAPAAGLRVAVSGLPHDGPRSRHEALTGADGGFRFDGVLPGPGEVLLRGDCGRAPLRRTVELPRGASLRLELVALCRPRRGTHAVEVRCEDAEGRGLVGIEVALHDFEEFEERCPTDAAGVARIEGLPAPLRGEDLWASVEMPGWQHAEEEVEADAPDGEPRRVVLRLEPTPPGPSPPMPWASFRRASPGTPPPRPDAPLSGVVLDADGVPFPGAHVVWVGEPTRAAEAAHGDTRRARRDRLAHHPVATSDSEGVFQCRGLPPGRCRVAATLSSSPSGRTAMEAAVDLDLPAGTGCTDVVLRAPQRMADLAVVDCVVVDDVGIPVDGVGIDVEGSLRDGLGFETDAFGRREFLVPAGRTAVRVFRSGLRDGARDELDVRAGERRRALIRMPLDPPVGPLHLRVRVVDDVGRPVPEAGVTLRGDDSLSLGSTSSEGILDCAGLPERLRSRPASVYASAFGYSSRGGGAHAEIIRWSPDGLAEVTLVLRRVARVIVIVVDAVTGRPVTGLNVEGGSVGRRASAGGRYSCGLHAWEIPAWFDMEPGPCVVRADAPGYEPGELRFEIRDPDERPTLELRLRRVGG